MVVSKNWCGLQYFIAVIQKRGEWDAYYYYCWRNKLLKASFSELDDLGTIAGHQIRHRSGYLNTALW